MGALAIIIESAALQSYVPDLTGPTYPLMYFPLPAFSFPPLIARRTWNLIFFVTYQAKSNIQFTTCDLWVPICGISLTLINLRVALGWAAKGHQSTSTGHPRVSTATGTQAQSFAASERGFAMRPLAVNISRVVEEEEDFGMKKTDYSSQGSVLPV